VIVLVASVAVSVHVPVPVNETVVKVAAPAVAASVVVPPSPQAELRTMESVEPETVASTLLLASSTATSKVESAMPVPFTVVGGATTKARCVGVPGCTVTAVLVAVVRVLVESVAVNVQLPAVSMIKPVNVAIPAAAVMEVTPESLHTDDRVMTSLSPVVEVRVAPLLVSTATVKLAITEPAE
jgi:hypothetical protein